MQISGFFGEFLVTLTDITILLKSVKLFSFLNIKSVAYVV